MEKSNYESATGGSKNPTGNKGICCFIDQPVFYLQYTISRPN